jgi:hypothetical protein
MQATPTKKKTPRNLEMLPQRKVIMSCLSKKKIICPLFKRMKLTLLMRELMKRK